MPAGGPEYQAQKYISEGLSVREVDGGDSGWTYSTAKWYVNFDPREDQNGTPLPFEIMSPAANTTKMTAAARIAFIIFSFSKMLKM